MRIWTWSTTASWTQSQQTYCVMHWNNAILWWVFFP